MGEGETSLHRGTWESAIPHLGDQPAARPRGLPWAITTFPLPSHRYFLKESPMCCFICCRPW